MHTGDRAMREKKTKKSELKNKLRNISMTTLMTWAVTSIVLVTLLSVVIIFINIYERSIEENTTINSEQTVAQAANTIHSYIDDMGSLMEILEGSVYNASENWDSTVENLLAIRSDVVAITTYGEDQAILDSWSRNWEYKEEIGLNLSYVNLEESNQELPHAGLNISKPHVTSMFVDEYPWVVTLSKNVITQSNESVQIGMDIQFSEIASYIDDVGIGQHGYCYIVDDMGNIIYHPQQNIIFSEIKEEPIEEITLMADGSYTRDNEIYTLQSLGNSNWRVVGVSYVDEMITSKVESMLMIVVTILVMVLFTSLAIGILFARVFSSPAKKLQSAMEDFETRAEEFQYQSVIGTKEINQLSDSFGHMVVRIQRLMEKVRKEEITLRKTELNALQSQINPHFLYNTLDSIAWMCEERRSEEAVEMVNALAKLFRISISRGHELIPIENEVEHARCYLQILNYRYKNQFTYAIEVEEGCKSYLCNKITLQPIIENSIYHGLDRMVDEGEIRIIISETEDEIIMSVEDNGVGMSEEQCEEILQREPGDRVGIGIKNVHDRIRIYFGEAYGLEIESELDEGTRVIIHMPKIKEGQYDEK